MNEFDEFVQKLLLKRLNIAKVTLLTTFLCTRCCGVVLLAHRMPSGCCNPQLGARQIFFALGFLIFVELLELPATSIALSVLELLFGLSFPSLPLQLRASLDG